MARYHGKSGVVYMAVDDVGSPEPVATLTSWSLDASRDNVEVTGFGDANKQYVPGLPNYTGAFAGVWEDDNDVIWQAADNAGGTNLYLYPSSDAATKYWYGPAYVDASIETSFDGAVRISANWIARGNWGRK